MKIGIVTIVSENYGNRLQNYALEKYLEKLDNNICVYTLKRNYSKNVFLGKVKKILSFILHPKTQYEQEKTKKFSEFDKNISFSSEILYRSKKNIALKNKYDFFIAGSDQVWNPEYPITSAADFMFFADRNQRLSYSASIGVSNFKNCDKKKFRDWISEVKEISVREETGKIAIEELTGRNVSVHVDPTLLLTREEWSKIEKRPEWYNKEKYILTYFLGPISEEAKKMIEKKSKREGLKIVAVDLKNQGLLYTHGPAEFIWLIHHCEEIYTDSFHGVVFSLIFGKKINIFKRTGNENSTGSRLECLLKKFELYKENEKIICVQNIDVDKIENKITDEREKSREYLKKCLGLNI